MSSGTSITKTYTGRFVNRPTSIYGYSELNRRAEELTLKVRGELSRMGCCPAKIRVQRQGIYVHMQHRHQVILADPFEVLAILKKMRGELTEETIWEQLNAKVRTVNRQRLKGSWWALGSLVLISALIFLLLYLARHA